MTTDLTPLAAVAALNESVGYGTLALCFGSSPVRKTYTTE